jgi:hypothetical protein
MPKSSYLHAEATYGWRLKALREKPARRGWLVRDSSHSSAPVGLLETIAELKYLGYAVSGACHADADTSGINALLCGIVPEPGVDAVLTKSVSLHAPGGG